MLATFQTRCAAGLLILCWILGACAAAVAAIDGGFCLSCHQKRTPGLFDAWARSKHAANGVDCAACHVDHSVAFPQDAMVFPERCGGCHTEEFREYKNSRHSIAWERMRVQGEYLAIPEGIRSAFCERCHLVEKRCNTCHTSHAFSVEEARAPAACGSCHLGPDHPHKEMYETSQHGVIYAATRDPSRAPTCVTCHMPDGSHDASHGIARGPVGTGSEVVTLDEAPLSPSEQRSRRADMLRVCTGCHSRRFAREKLEAADRVKEAGFRLLAKGEAAVRALGRANLLLPDVDARSPHPTEGRRLVLGDPQIYVGTSQAERLFFSMFKFHNVHTWKSAYHFSPSYSYSRGWAEMETDLIEIETEATRLRELLPAGTR